MSRRSDILDSLPSFRPRFPWWGGDLQTIANRLRPPSRELAPHSSERLCIPLKDGTGDTLMATLNRPAEPRIGSPLAILIHGLTGAEDSLYMLSQARLMLERGASVLRLNLRGAGPSRAVCSEHYYAGRSQDFRTLLGLLPLELTHNGIVAVGYSLGGAMLLKYLGEQGTATPLQAAASISAPIDLQITSRNMMRARNVIYHRHILAEMKREATGEGARLTEAHRAAIMMSRSVWEYDDTFIAPRYGFSGAEDYYQRCKPLRFMPAIRVPTLILAAFDDPWIPGALYEAFDWKCNMALTPLLTGSGGHVGFHGADSIVPWSDRAVVRFFAL